MIETDERDYFAPDGEEEYERQRRQGESVTCPKCGKRRRGKGGCEMCRRRTAAPYEGPDSPDRDAKGALNSAPTTPADALEDGRTSVLKTAATRELSKIASGLLGATMKGVNGNMLRPVIGGATVVGSGLLASKMMGGMRQQAADARKQEVEQLVQQGKLPEWELAKVSSRKMNHNPVLYLQRAQRRRIFDAIAKHFGKV